MMNDRLSRLSFVICHLCCQCGMRVSGFHLACPASLMNGTSNRLTKRYRVPVVIRFDIDFDFNFGSYSLTVLNGQIFLLEDQSRFFRRRKVY
jgi:hypothetical protein